MASHPLLDFIRRLRRARSVAEGGHLADAQLLERFAKQRDEAAFEVLVWRHGTMVLNVARRLIRQTADAEDVFQATFLTLARKASAIRRSTSIGSWLYKVAYRLALRVRQTALRRPGQEQHGIENAHASDEPGDEELSVVLAQEVDRLPERFRAVVVMCYLQGATTEEASRLLGCPRGTVLSRLATARQRLRQRLLRRGIAPTLALAAVSFGEEISAAPAVALVASVVRAALPFAAGGAAVPIVSPKAAALAKGALQTMMWNKIKRIVAIVGVIALVGTGSGWLARGRNVAEAPLPAAEPPVKKDGLPVAPLPLAADFQKEIDHNVVQLAKLADEEDQTEQRFIKSVVQARLDLTGAQDYLRLTEQERDSERQKEQERRKAAALCIAQVEEQRRVIEERGKSIGAFSEPLKALTDSLETQKKIFKEVHRIWRESDRELYQEGLLHRREQVLDAEYKLRRIERRHAQAQEEFAVKRQTLLARLEQLEAKKLGLEPADHPRDMERKLDALRREVGELRRALGRQEKDLRK